MRAQSRTRQQLCSRRCLTASRSVHGLRRVFLAAGNLSADDISAVLEVPRYQSKMYEVGGNVLAPLKKPPILC